MHYYVTTALILGLLLVLPVVVGVRTTKAKIVVPLAVLVTAGSLAWFWTWAFDRTAQTEVLTSVVSVSGAELVVRYIGSECQDQRSVDVDEDEDDRTVRISVTSRSFASGCSDIGVPYDVSITLERPLGTREIVNVGCTPDHRGCRAVLEPPA